MYIFAETDIRLLLTLTLIVWKWHFSLTDGDTPKKCIELVSTCTSLKMIRNIGSDAIKIMSNFIQTSKAYDNTVLKKLNFVSAGSGQCLAEIKVSPEHLNGGGGLHGGFTTALVDSVTSTALWSHERCGIRHIVSVDISVSYLKEAKEGDNLVIEAKTLKADRPLAYVDVELKDKTEGHIIAKGSHTLFVGELWKISEA